MIDNPISPKACSILILYLHGLGSKAQFINASPQEAAVVVNLSEALGCRDSIKGDIANDILAWMEAVSLDEALTIAKGLVFHSQIVCCGGAFVDTAGSLSPGGKVVPAASDDEEVTCDESSDDEEEDAMVGGKVEGRSGDAPLPDLSTPWSSLKFEVSERQRPFWRFHFECIIAHSTLE